MDLEQKQLTPEEEELNSYLEAGAEAQEYLETGAAAGVPGVEAPVIPQAPQMPQIDTSGIQQAAQTVSDLSLIHI